MPHPQLGAWHRRRKDMVWVGSGGARCRECLGPGPPWAVGSSQSVGTWVPWSRSEAGEREKFPTGVCPGALTALSSVSTPNPSSIAMGKLDASAAHPLLLAELHSPPRASPLGQALPAPHAPALEVSPLSCSPRPEQNSSQQCPAPCHCSAPWLEGAAWRPPRAQSPGAPWLKWRPRSSGSKQGYDGGGKIWDEETGWGLRLRGATMWEGANSHPRRAHPQKASVSPVLPSLGGEAVGGGSSPARRVPTEPRWFPVSAGAARAPPVVHRALWQPDQVQRGRLRCLLRADPERAGDAAAAPPGPEAGGCQSQWDRGLPPAWPGGPAGC